jgi:hypothetical protein
MRGLAADFLACTAPMPSATAQQHPCRRWRETYFNAHELGAFVIGGQFDAHLHDPSFPLGSPMFVIGGNLQVPSSTSSAGQ